jgi:hypothetical protein
VSHGPTRWNLLRVDATGLQSHSCDQSRHCCLRAHCGHLRELIAIPHGLVESIQCMPTKPLIVLLHVATMIVLSVDPAALVAAAPLQLAHPQEQQPRPRDCSSSAPHATRMCFIRGVHDTCQKPRCHHGFHRLRCFWPEASQMPLWASRARCCNDCCICCFTAAPGWEYVLSQ